MQSTSPTGFVSSFKAKIPFLNRNKGGSHMRAHSRHPCCLMAELLIPEKAYKLEGLVIEIARGGVRFREASTFILNRMDTTCVVLVNGMEFAGVIVNVGTNGYGIKLDSLMAEGELEKLLAIGKPDALQQPQ